MAKPNILIIVADDLGVDSFRIDKLNKKVTAKVASTGPVELTTFTSLLNKGVHFEHAWAHPVCTPTRASLFTGLQAWKTKLGYPAISPDRGNLPEKSATGAPVETLAKALKPSGYACAMFGKWDLGLDKDPVQRGWDHFEGILGGGLAPVGRRYGFADLNRVTLARLESQNTEQKDKCQAAAKKLKDTYDQKYGADFLKNNPDLRYYIWEKTKATSNTVPEVQSPGQRPYPYATEDQVESAKAWIMAQTKPWCVALNLITPHDPFHVPPLESCPKSRSSISSPPTVQQMLVAMLESMDHYVGKLLTAIDNQLANTVIIFVGDNGTQDTDPDAPPESPVQVDGKPNDDKGTHAIGGVHVPMIVADGGLMNGRNTPCYLKGAPRSLPNPVHIIDVYRTVLEIAGVSSTAETDSISMAPHLTNSAGPKRRFNFSQMYHIGEAQGKKNTAGYGASICDSDPQSNVPHYKLTCSARTTETRGVQGNLTFENGNPVFEYKFSELEKDTDITGSFVEKQLAAITFNGTTHTISNAQYRKQIMELYSEMRREYLDDKLTAFPIIDVSGANMMLHQFVSAPQVWNYQYGQGSSAPATLRITNMPKDTDITRWAVVHDNYAYRMCCFQGGTTDKLYPFLWNGSSCDYDRSMGTITLVNFPQDADTSRFGMLHDNGQFYLCLRKRGAPLLYTGVIDPGRKTCDHNHGQGPRQITVAGFPSDMDWGRWTVLHNNQNYLFAAMRTNSDDEVYQGEFDRRDNSYRMISTGKILGAPAQSCNFRSFSMLHDNGSYRLYFMSV